MIEEKLRQAAQALDAGDYARAEALSEQVLAAAPRNIVALHLLGVARLGAGRAAQAVAPLREALRVDAEDLRVLDALSAALAAAGDYVQAEVVVRRALALGAEPGLWRARLGLALAAQQRWEEAAECFEEALRHDPRSADTHHHRGQALMKLGRCGEALASFERARILEPDNAHIVNAVGAALHELGRVDEALDCYRRALELDAGLALAHHNLGKAFLDRGELERAVSCYRRAIALQPDYADAHCALGSALVRLARWDEALASFERARALDPGSVNAQYNLALALLFLQQFGEAWPLYERRFERRDMRTRYRSPPETWELFERMPRWRGPGEAFSGELAIWAEQGIGDQVLFSTLIPELLDAAVPFVYEVDPRLQAAYERAFPDAHFVPRADPPREELRRAARALMAGSLPGFFRRSREDFARQPAKLLSAIPERVAYYRGRLEALGPGLKVALSWWSSRQDPLTAAKSASLAQFAPVLRLPGARFVDVQYGDTEAERAAVEQSLGVEIVRFAIDHFHDLEELLAILEACDLVITTSNATAHFAGALGKRTWLLYLADRPPFHYWAHGGERRCLWYPSVEIVTAPQLADWASLIGHVAERLARLRTGAIAASGGRSSADAPHDAQNPLLGALARLRQQGRYEEAAAAARRALERAPEDGPTLCELAHALRLQGKLDEALRAAARATESAPNLASAWFNLGAVLVARGEAAQGIEAYRKALALRPDFPEAWSNLGEALGARGERSAEIEAYRRAIALHPRLAPVWSNLGAALLEAGRVEEAISACRQAVEIAPEFAAGWNNLGSALLEADRIEEALEACERAVETAPASGEAWSNLGSALLEAGKVEQAFAAHRRALEIEPRDARSHYNLGIAHERCLEHDAALACYRTAVGLDPDFAAARMRLGCVLLMRGEFSEGWPLYEWRWREKGAPPKRYDFAQWTGEKIPGLRLLLWGEQGIGDEIIYSSMIGELVAAGLDVTLETDSRLVPIMRRSFPRLTVVPRTDPPGFAPKAFDRQCPLASLGRWLRPSFDSFPRHGGYLEADAALVARFSARLRHGWRGKVVGVSWVSKNRKIGAEKSVSLAEWSQILGVAGIRFVDLQYGDTARAREELWHQRNLEIVHLDDVDLFHDLEGFAALCAACDLVITVSNVTAHMAGALGKPVWLLAPRAKGRIWYWFAGRSDSPWYPSMRIFAQSAPGDWRETLAEVARELALFVQGE